MIVVIDGQKIQNRDELHDSLIQALALPDWYGRNLDALRDCLTDPRETTILRVLHADVLRNTLGPYADIFFRVLRESESGFFHWEESV